MMKLQSPAWLAGNVALFLSVALAAGQGTFQNLDFEQANYVRIPGNPFYCTTANALPGWGLYVDGAPQPLMMWGVAPRAPIVASIYDAGFGFVIQGNYSLRLQPGGPSMSLLPVLVQTGTVPLGAQTILVDSIPYTTPIQLGFAGQQIALSVVSGSASTFYTYAGDISSFAGQTGELSLWGDVVLDNIRFDVPEPNVFGLSALGVLLVGCRVLRRRCKRN